MLSSSFQKYMQEKWKVLAVYFADAAIPTRGHACHLLKGDIQQLTIQKFLCAAAQCSLITTISIGEIFL